jgi:hypothetical protein
MITVYILLGVIVVEILCAIFLKQTWLKAGIYSSITLGLVSAALSAILQMNGNPENTLLFSFFVLNMLLPLLLSIDIHFFFDKVEKEASRNTPSKARKKKRK